MTDQELAAIEARANAATPGPWKAINIPFRSGDNTYSFWEVYHDRDGVGDSGGWYAVGDDYTEITAQFVAATRTDIPALVAEVRRLRAIEAAARAYCATWDQERYKRLLDALSGPRD